MSEWGNKQMRLNEIQSHQNWSYFQSVQVIGGWLN